MFRFFLAHSKSSGVATRPQVHGSPSKVMCVGSEDMHASFIQHAFRPIPSGFAEFPQQRSCGNLHPNSAMEKTQYLGVMRVDPGQTLRMRQNRHITSHYQAEKRLGQSGRVNMAWRFDEHVPAVGEREESSFPQSGR